MKTSKTREAKLWSYLSKKLGNTKTAKQVYTRVAKEFKSSKKEIIIEYKADTRPLKESLRYAKALTKELKKIRISI
jgi:predicted RND superfamily exporter protein